MIPQDVIDRIQEASDIVDIVSSYFPLKRSGRNFKALCPFHNEKTPSFMVSPDKQIWHCFGCGAGGSVFSFVMQYERVAFPEAVKMLAARAGIRVPERAVRSDEEGEKKSDLYRLNEFALSWYQQQLAGAAAKAVREYLAQRGLDEETVRTFGIGFAPGAWDGLYRAARAKKFSDGMLLTLGLAMRKEGSGRTFDRFRRRIMIPIRDAAGRVIGFSGRIWGEGSPKYMNSPESPLFNKSKSLYGIDVSKRHIADSGSAIVVEGYFDYYALYKAGIRNVVASQGTAFTSDHARIIKRYAGQVIMSFDADSAGETASLRGLDAFIEAGLLVRVLALPSGHDPDSFVRKRGGDAFAGLVKVAPDYFDYLLDLLCARHGLSSAASRARIASEFLSALSRVRDAVLREAYLQRISERISISMAALMQEMGKKKAGGGRPAAPAGKGAAPIGRLPASERELVRLMLEDEAIARLVAERLTLSDFRHPHLREIAGETIRMVENGRRGGASPLISRFAEGESARLVSAILAEKSPEADRVRVAEDCITTILRRNSRERSRKIREDITRREREGASPHEILELQKNLMKEKEKLLKLL